MTMTTTKPVSEQAKETYWKVLSVGCAGDGIMLLEEMIALTRKQTIEECAQLLCAIASEYREERPPSLEKVLVANTCAAAIREMEVRA